MSDIQHNCTPEELPSSEPSMPDLTPDHTSTTETLMSVDATPSDVLLAGSTDNGSFSSQTPGSSASSHGDEVGQARSHSDMDPTVNKRYPGDPLLHPSQVTYSYAVPENIRPLDSYPRGYPRMAACQACDANFSIYRKFGWLHNRVLLHLQAELSKLEFDLQTIDDKQAESREFKERTKLAEYDALVFRLQRKNTMKRPTRTNQSSVMRRACTSVVASEAEWTFRTDDLVALADDAAEQSWFNYMMHYAWILAPRLFTGIFQSRERRIKTGSLHFLHIMSPTRSDAFYRAILTVIGTAIVLGPISYPSLLSRNPILTIYASTLGFSIFCAVFTKASRDQVFAATGGYCALQVIVMLLGPHLKQV
ncbi:MAG: hypothetical protein ALECFALPRED_002202 [Alectoria fallacina]|uniref:DUF6594 domain-containing protein n=1 Tax=Alectoria fallacina TaxID=1903189 RepID=A0A8H3EGZ3_9LECA|nr:MAG: hypothetical protein ALECFALPRED_002202 [Alectoria fallacina]